MKNLIARCMRLGPAVEARAAALSWLLIAGAVAAVPPAALAQPPQTGGIYGNVTTNDDQPLPGATVRVRAIGLTLDRTATTAADGSFSLIGLPGGQYEIAFEANGWKPQILRVLLGANASVSLVAALNPGAAVSDEITVTADEAMPPPVDKLPLVDRGPFGAAGILSAGVQQGTAPGQLRMGGGLAYDNIFLVNGVDVSDNLFGAPFALFTEDAVVEYRAVTTGFGAEYGRTTGGLVSVVTREGTNEYHGSFRADFSARALTAAHRLEGAELDGLLPAQSIYQGTLGGPVLRDRLWFFATGRGSRLDQDRQLGARGPTADPLITGSEIDEGRWEGRLTFSPRESHRLIGSYLDVERDEAGLPSLGAASATPGTGLTPTTAMSLTNAQYHALVSEHLSIEGQYWNRTFGIVNGGNTSRDRFDSPLFTTNGAVHVANPARNGLVDEERDADSFRSSLSYLLDQLGSHTFKGGLERTTHSRSGNSALSSTGFAVLTDFERDAGGNIALDGSGGAVPIFVPGLSRGIFYPSLGASEVRATTTSLYASDELRFDRLTLTGGVRYDRGRVEADGAPMVESGVVQPRVGVTFALDRRFTVSGNSGTYAGRYDVKQFSGGVLDPVSHFQIYTGPSGRGMRFAPGFDPANYATFALSDPSLTTRVDPDATPALVRGFGVRADYTVLRGRFAIAYDDRSYSQVIESLVPSGPPTTITSGIVSTRTDTTRIGVSDAVDRSYRALTAEWNYRPSAQWHVGGTYTGEIGNEGNYVGETAGGSPAFSAIDDYPAMFDATRHFEVANLINVSQPHRVRSWTVYTQPLTRGTLDVGGVFAFDSGRSYLFQAVVPRTPIQTAIAASAGYVSPPASQTISFNGQGGRFEAAHRLDLSLTYTLDMTGGLELWVKGDLFNVYNQQARIAFDVSGTAGGPTDALGLPTTFMPAPTFGRARSILDLQNPREFRFAVGLRF